MLEGGIRMAFATRSVMAVGALVMLGARLCAQDQRPYAGPACTRPAEDYFAKEVWPKVGAALCLQCHKKGGDAEASRLILKDPRQLQGHAQDDALRHNRDAFARLAAIKHKGQSRLLVKVTGGLRHGGDDVLKPGSKGYLIVAEFVRRINAPKSAMPPTLSAKDLPPFWDGVVMLDSHRLLRRVTLSLAGRLPTDAERRGSPSTGSTACRRCSMP